MKKLLKNKKGTYRLQDLAPLAVIFVVAAIVLGFGAKVLDEIDDEFTDNTTQWNVVQNGTYALNKMGKWLPTLAIVVVAALIISVVVSAFYFGRR
jgi:type II secretory pathway component PulF